MKLQTKTSVIVASVFTASCLVVLGLFHHVILREFKLLESSRTQLNMARLEGAFQQSLEALIDHSKDWGWWDEVYTFIDHPSPEFIDKNLTYETIASLGFRHIGFLNSKLELVHGLEIDTSREEITQLSQIAKNILVNTKVFERLLSQEDQNAAMFAGIEGHAFMVSASPIKRESSEESNGVVFITREIDAPLLDRFKQITKVNFKANPVGADNSPKHVPSSLITADAAFSPVELEEFPETIVGHSNIRDFFGQPILSLEALFSREIYQSGLATEKFFGFMFLFTLMVSGTVAVLLIRSFVVSPVRRLGATLQSITIESDFNKRVEVRGSDEIGTLSGQINETLTALQLALGVAEEAQQAAESANQSKSSFIAKVSHELRTPIHSITGMLRILLKEEPSSAKRNYIMMARNSAYGLLETINEILDFSKSEACQLSLERIGFSPHEVIREAVQTVGPRVEEAGSVETIVEVAQGIPDKFYGDPLRLRQVLINLLGNAAKFTKNGHIGLRVEMAQTKSEQIVLEMAVFDTGVGIPEDRLERIFEPFGQADDSISRLFSGTGLGLTIVKQLVEAMGGTVRVESTLGVGSSFILSIPFDVCPDAKPIIYKPSLSSPRVALLDGDSEVANRLSSSLEKEGYQPYIIRSNDPVQIRTLALSVHTYGLILVTSDALKRSHVFDLVVSLRGEYSVPVVSILSPFEISTRERLLALQIPFVVTRPIALLDIFGVVSGQLSLHDDGWQDAEDSSLLLGRPLAILVADDAQTNQIILTELLQDAGHHVVCVENGLDMVARVRETFEGGPNSPKFDIILSDVQMPLLDGLNATSQIRSLEKEHNVSTRLPIVAVTAHAMTEETSRMRSFGVDDVVTKPLDPKKLGEVIKRLTGQPTATDSPPSHRAAATPLSATELAGLGLRLWRKITKRSSEISNLFGLSDEPSSPECFQQVIDVPDVIERSGDSVRRTLCIFHGFLECYREQILKLGEAKRARSVADMRFASHALKGLLLDIGAHISAELASSIEQNCKHGHLEQADNLVSSLTKQTLVVSRLISQITLFADGNSSTDASEMFLNAPGLIDARDYE